MEHHGSNSLTVMLLDRNGERGFYPGYLALGDRGPVLAAIGVVRGFNIFAASPGEHLLNIDADGAWEITIRQPRYATAPSIPVTFTGTGDTVAGPFLL